MKRIPLTAEGYVGMGEFLAHAPTYSWLCGGRGTGKTFGAFLEVRYNNPCKFILMRRTQEQINLLRKPMFNPFKPVDAHAGGLTAIKPDGKIGVIYEGEKTSSGEIEPVGAPIGYAVALATVHNVRGIDLSDVDLVIYDEFIPEAHERPIKAEWEALLNALETIGRNRELQGRPPLRLLALTNSNQLGNPYFLGMGVIRIVDRMIQTGREVWEDREKGVLIGLLRDSPISAQKASTALYRLAGERSDFAAMSLGNEFVGDVCSRQGTAPLVELRPIASIGEITIYEHKHSGRLYCNGHRSGNPPTYAPDDMGLKRARRDQWALVSAYLDNAVTFQDVLCEILFRKYFAL